MAGNEHIPTAPVEAIGDDGDLREMRDALRAGKRAVLASDGKVYVGTEDGTPMTADQESFIESKLGHVIELARAGYGVSVSPDGSIFADRADHLAKVLYDPDPNLSEQQRLLIQRGVSEGAQVRVHADGRVEYFLAKDAAPPPAAQAVRLQQAIDAEISSGRLLAEMADGRTLSANPDGSLDYRTTGSGPEPVLFPEDARLPENADEFEAEAEALELGAGAARIGGLEDYLHGRRAADAGSAEAGRQRAAAEGAAREAERQAAEAEQSASELGDAERAAWSRAATARVAGDAATAQEETELAQGLAVRAINARLAAEAAREAHARLHAEAAQHAARELRLDGEATEVQRHAKRLEDVFDAQEQQAVEYRRAAAELREAERLEAAIPDLEARGVPGVERVRAAAAEHRRMAAEAAERGHAVDQADRQPHAMLDASSDAGTIAVEDQQEVSVSEQSESGESIDVAGVSWAEPTTTFDEPTFDNAAFDDAGFEHVDGDIAAAETFEDAPLPEEPGFDQVS